MPRYKLTIEYDGTAYCGWQRQKDARSVQQTLEQAFERFVGGPVTLFVAGRTDTGVHALAQIAHVDLPTLWDGHKLANALNAHLRGETITVIAAEAVRETFDARFSAFFRVYDYHILNRAQPSALLRNRAWHIKKPLDAAAMRAGAAFLVGHHDFTTFRASKCQAKSPMRTLDALDIRVSENRERIIFRARSRSFLHAQVRSMIGTLKCVGEGRWQPEDVRRALCARDRTACGALAPACGLYLVEVGYQEEA